MSKEINYIPTEDGILIQAKEIKETTDAGVFLPVAMQDKQAKEHAEFLKVLAVGEEVKKIKVGEEIYLARVPVEVNIDGVKYWQCREHDVIGKRKVNTIASGNIVL